MKRSHLPLLLATIPLLLMLPQAGASEGQEALGVTPPTATVEDALPGETYVEYVTLQNEYDTPTTFDATLRGDVEPWTHTEPETPITVPARTHQEIAIVFDVPEDAYVGSHTGQLSLTGEPREDPDGTGASIRASVAVQLAVDVGGDAVEELTWLHASSEDVAIGSPIHATITVANTGNTKTLAEAEAVLKDPDRGEPLQEASGAVDLRPGEKAPINLVFPDPVPMGTYQVLVESDSGDFQDQMQVNVVPASDLGKEGVLRYLKHEPTTRVDRPLRVDAVFENTGEVPISDATFHGEVHKDGELVAVLESDGTVVQEATEEPLTSFFEPTEPGTYTLKGYVNYDGLRTETRESDVRVSGEPDASEPGTFLYVIAGLLVGLLILVILVYRSQDS